MQKIDGRTQGLKASELKGLLALFRRKSPASALFSNELVKGLASISRALNRQVGVLVNRVGEVERVVLGEASRLYLPDLGRARAGAGRLRGLRLLRAELRSQALSNEDLADLSKLRLDAVVVVEADASGQPRRAHWAHLVPDARDRAIYPEVESFDAVHAVRGDAMALVLEAEAEMTRLFGGGPRVANGTGALLVGIERAGPRAREHAEDSMHELEELARTAGVQVVDSVVQIRRELDARTVVGKGKIEELTLRALELGAEVLIFDRDLGPSQLRAITNETDLKVLDRTQLILDIFAQHARSKDGKIQVELAQLKYTLPRLVEKSTAMSRLTGGIGGQGPGETKLEIHRRRARDRIQRLEKEIDKLSVERRVRRSHRGRSSVPLVSIVGYTNVGKSTLLNAITNADVPAEDKLFATLDTTSRRVRFPSDHEIVLTDTVGFIRDLPRDLVNAFKATLEELAEADLILHVVDASDPKVDEKMRAVDAILADLGLDGIDRLIVVNKIDDAPGAVVSALVHVTHGVAVSAIEHQGLDRLVDAIVDRAFTALQARRRLESADEHDEARARVEAIAGRAVPRAARRSRPSTRAQ
ncbi:MAG: GTPase HflX [Deltaproteobacteria bacterium]|nr:GTPase HflX [Deltaproteobacteria bacterium]